MFTFPLNEETLFRFKILISHNKSIISVWTLYEKNYFSTDKYWKIRNPHKGLPSRSQKNTLFERKKKNS